MFTKLFTYFQRSWTKFGLGRRIVWKLFKLSVSFLSQGCSLVFLNGIFADSSKIHPIFACVSVCKSIPDICHFCYTFWGLKMLLHPKVHKSATKKSNPGKYIFVFVFVFVYLRKYLFWARKAMDRNSKELEREIEDFLKIHSLQVQDL